MDRGKQDARPAQPASEPGASSSPSNWQATSLNIAEARSYRLCETLAVGTVRTKTCYVRLGIMHGGGMEDYYKAIRRVS